MGVFDDIVQGIFGTGVTTLDKGGITDQYTRGGLFGRGGPFERKQNRAAPPRVQQYAAPTPSPQPTQAPTPSQGYSSLSPGLAPIGGVTSSPVPGPYEFPSGDKPPVPEQYHQQLAGIENNGIVGSVLAQETGGYGYQAPDPETGEIVDWETARQKNIRGAAGEVGMAQIIPKWHFKAAGFPDEESYAQALYDPQFSIDEAGRILNQAFSIYGDWKKALGTWNKAPSYPDEILSRLGIPIK